MKYWRRYPPTHVILASRYMDRSAGDAEMNKTERALQASMPVTSFDNLPLHVQAALAAQEKNG